MPPVNIKHLLKRAIFATITSVFVFASTTSNADTLENLERERAQFIDLMLDQKISQKERQSRGDAAKRRLIDLERLVLRDESLKGKSTPIVHRAFANYDLTFLAHSSLEKERTLFETWMGQVGLTTDALLSARLGTNLSLLQVGAN